MDPCIFCEIVAARSPASVVYADDLVWAFMDINPIAPGHTLVVPTAHYVGLLDLDDGTARHMISIAQKVARGIAASELRSEGFNLFLADGEAAGQDVFHSHLHVIPRFPGDGFIVSAEVFDRARPRADLDHDAELIRRNFDRQAATR